VVGLGLIGGSIARRLAEFPDRYEPIGYDIREESRAGLEVAASVEDLAKTAELMIVAVPPKATVGVIKAALEADPDVLVTDVASVKAPITRELGPQERYLPSHPLAGGETTGWRAARPELLHGTTWAVCPPGADGATPELLCRWGEVLDTFDARLVVCDPEDHDAAVARTSHAPHLISLATAASLAQQPNMRLAAALSGGVLREIVRVASSDPALWAQILALNEENVAAALTDARNAISESPNWNAGAQMASLVDALRWRDPMWERREFAWPAWDELKELGRKGVAIRRPAIAGGPLSADVAVHPDLAP
jgi:prephenate dehydrogenase